MIGKQIANYRILEKLGEGGMGAVFKGVDINLDRPVAIKMLKADLANNPGLVERFRTEAKTQANLNHVNLATLYAFLVDQGTAFMVMEFVEGETFEQIIRNRGPLPPEQAVPWFKQALLGMGAAHRMGIVHRDIKPSNLMLNSKGIVKVMDFGIAKVVGTLGLTRTGMQPGTPAYMAPEQIQNRAIDVRTDIYALGITLYQMLSGQVPFSSGSDFDIMNEHVAVPPPPLTRMFPYAPVQYQNVVMKALEKDPDKRYQTVEEFGAALEHPESIPAPFGATPVSPDVTRTVIATAVPSSSEATAQAPVAPSRIAATTPASIPVSPVVAGPPVAGKNRWNSRYTIAAGGVGAAMILLAILVFARKPAVVGVSQGNAPSPGSLNSLLVQPKAEVILNDGSPLPNPGSPGGPSTISQVQSESTSNKGETRGASAQPSPPSRHSNISEKETPFVPPAPEPLPDVNAPKDVPSATAGMSPAEVEELENRIDQLSTRVAAINNSLDHLQRQQAAAGYGLRGDMAAAQANMQMNLSKAQNAMERGDAAKAKKYADLAAASAETLEHFLGR